MMMFLLIACTSDHSFKLDERRQIIVVHNLLHLEIESDSSQTDEGHFFFIVKENPYDSKEFDTIKTKTVIRATADNPFLFYEAAEESAALFEEKNLKGHCDYLTYSGLPHGSGVEVFSADSLLSVRCRLFRRGSREKG